MVKNVQKVCVCVTFWIFSPAKTSSSARVFLPAELQPYQRVLQCPAPAQQEHGRQASHPRFCCRSPAHTRSTWASRSGTWSLAPRPPAALRPGGWRRPAWLAGSHQVFTLDWWTLSPRDLQAGEKKPQPALWLTHQHVCWISCWSDVCLGFVSGQRQLLAEYSCHGSFSVQRNWAKKSVSWGWRWRW